MHRAVEAVTAQLEPRIVPQAMSREVYATPPNEASTDYADYLSRWWPLEAFDAGLIVGMSHC